MGRKYKIYVVANFLSYYLVFGMIRIWNPVIDPITAGEIK